MFAKTLREVMDKLSINQTQLAGLTGKSKASISTYLSGGGEPTEQGKRDMAVALGLSEDYFQEHTPEELHLRDNLQKGEVIRMLPEQAAALLGVDVCTVRKGLQQGVFPWGYAIKTSPKRWSYFINAKRFAEVERMS